MTIKDMDAWIAEQSGKPYVIFRLGGSEFHVRNPLPAWPGMRLAREQMSTIDSWAQFLREVVIPLEAGQIDDAIARSGIHVEGLLELCKHVVEESSAKPTTPRAGTSGTRRPRGRPSKSATPSRASRSTTSLSVAS